MNAIAYHGTGLAAPVPIRRSATQTETLHPYLAGPELVKAVNLAILLERPLLLMGEPGCGKSRLAEAVAYELHHQMTTGPANGLDDIQRDYRDFYFEWLIKSTSQAQDGLYAYDAIRRLGDAQILGQQQLSATDLEQRLDKTRYRKFVGFGEAIRVSNRSGRRAVLLIDEIDKADMDFPNDLLNELDRGVFTIPETGERIVAEVKPIVFITSNSEKDLPDAFLRRCLYHYIKPLGKEMLTDILQRRFYDQQPVDNELIETAVEQFLNIRKYLRQQQMSVGKNVSTSELIDWFTALKYYDQLRQEAAATGQPADPQLRSIIQDLDKLGGGAQEIPFPQTLFKNWNTLINFEANRRSTDAS
mgnify:FL=1